MTNQIPEEDRKKIEAAVKELSKLSTASDKETPDWMESDIRRGIERGYTLGLQSAEKEIETLKGNNATLYNMTNDFTKEIERLRELVKEWWMNCNRFTYNGNNYPDDIMERWQKYKDEKYL